MLADRGSWQRWRALMLIFSNGKNQGMMGNTCCQSVLKVFNNLNKLIGKNPRINLYFQSQRCIPVQLYVTDHWCVGLCSFITGTRHWWRCCHSWQVATATAGTKHSFMAAALCLARGYYCLSPLPRFASAIRSEPGVQSEEEAAVTGAAGELPNAVCFYFICGKCQNSNGGINYF